MEDSAKKQERSSVRGFGAKLQAEREAREITIEEISRVTRVSAHLLRAMEQDNWQDLPGGIFTRNFIRLYARHLGLDGEKLVDEFVQFIDIKNKAELPEKKEDQGYNDSSQDNNYTWMYVTLAATIVLLIAGFFLVNSFSSNNNQPDVNPVNNPQTDQDAINTETTGQTSEGNTDSSVILTEEESSGLRIELVETSRASVWFQWRADGDLKSPPDGENLRLNQSRIFEAEESLWFNLARLQSIKLHINGEERQWQDFSPRAMKNEDGATISYIVEFKLSDLEQ